MRTVGTALLCAAVAMCMCCPALAGNTGLGLIAGEPTGLSFKMWIGGSNALDAAGGWSIGDNEWVYLHADYLHHRYDLHIPDLDKGMPYYYGIGGRILFREGHDSKLGARIPLGLDYVFGSGRFDVFIELAPVIDLIPETDLGLSGGIGARYWF